MTALQTVTQSKIEGMGGGEGGRGRHKYRYYTTTLVDHEIQCNETRTIVIIYHQAQVFEESNDNYGLGNSMWDILKLETTSLVDLTLRSCEM